MPTYSWGSGGTQRTTNTSGTGDGWYTQGLACPNPRTIYDGSMPMKVHSVAATAGSGPRAYRYALGSSGWISSGYHVVLSTSVFSFRVTNTGGTIYLALLLGQSGKDTYWVDGSLAPSGSDAVQPGTMTWYQAPGSPTVNSIVPSATAGAAVVNITAPSDNGGTSITNYTHQISTSSSFSSITKEVESTASATTITGLPTGQTLYHRVMAQNAVTDNTNKKGGAASVTTSFSLGTVPGKVSGVTVTEPTTTTLLVKWSAVTANPATEGYDVQWSTNSSFSGAPSVTTTATSRTLTGLTPGTTYYVRVRAFNDIGDGAYSNTVTAYTVPNVPPGFGVVPSSSGKSAVLTFSPPGGMTGVVRYNWERRIPPGTTATPGSSTSTTQTVSNLTPGVTYEWRAHAEFSNFVSPWTGWLSKRQPNPNTNPGDYFDGSTADADADVDYKWGSNGAGTAHASISIAVGESVLGWQVIPAAGAVATVHQVTAEFLGTFAARVTFTRDATADHNRMGQHAATGYWSDVTSDVTYVGSIHVLPSREQRMAAEITWLDAAGAVLSRTEGTASVVPGGTWTRLGVGGVSPALAEWAVVRAIDVSGTSWSTFKGGDVVDLDGAMISLNELFPYFDGSTLDDEVYVYDWIGTAHASTSTRTPTDEVETVMLSSGLIVPRGRALVDPDCDPVPPPPRPPTVPDNCIETVGVWRRYYTEIPSDLVPNWIDVVPTLEITTGSGPARQVRIRYYANAQNKPPDQVNTTTWVAEQIISYIPANTKMTLDGITQRVWAQIGSANPQSADHLLYGTNGRPPTWPVLSCGIAYLVSVEVPIDQPAGNLDIEASLTARS